MSGVLSLSMIVRDCATELDRCLASCYNAFDEIIIVDTGSRDTTRDVAKKYNAQIYDFPWIDDFSAARNFSLGEASCPWIMWLDADDIIEPDDLKKLIELKEELGTSQKDAYMLIYRYNAHIHGYTYRIFRNIPEIQWKYPVHESLIFPDLSKIEKRDIWVCHTGESKGDRNFYILKKACSGKWQNDGRMLHYLAREHYYRGEYEEAINIYRQHLNIIPEYTKLGAYYYYAESCLKTGNIIKALDICGYASKKASHFSDFECLLGEYYFSEKQWDPAKKYFESTIGKSYPTDTCEVFMLQDNYGFTPRARLRQIEQFK